MTSQASKQWPSDCSIFNTTGSQRHGPSNGNSLGKTSRSCSRKLGIRPEHRPTKYETVFMKRCTKLRNAPGEFWLLYSVVIQSDVRATEEIRISSSAPVQ